MRLEHTGKLILVDHAKTRKDDDIRGPYWENVRVEINDDHKGELRVFVLKNKKKL